MAVNFLCMYGPAMATKAPELSISELADVLAALTEVTRNPIEN